MRFKAVRAPSPLVPLVLEWAVCVIMHSFAAKSPCEGTVEFSDSVNRWGGPGNAEFRNNLARAFSEKKPILLVEVLTDDPGHVEAGRDASQVKKEFYLRRELIGEVIEYNKTTGRYVIRFVRL